MHTFICVPALGLRPFPAVFAAKHRIASLGTNSADGKAKTMGSNGVFSIAFQLDL
jgi:hypothetical protein